MFNIQQMLNSQYSTGDESLTFFPYALVFSCAQDGLDTYSSVAKLAGGTAGDLFAGFDVGRTRNASELIVLERVSGRLLFRLRKTLMGEKFQAQEAILRDLMASTPRLQRLCIDRGIVAQGPHASAWGMSSREQGKARLLRMLQAEACSAKKSATEGGYARFDTDRNEKHHGDALWALALAVRAAGGTGKEARKRRAVHASVV
jgi:hypothetical protein